MPAFDIHLRCCPILRGGKFDAATPRMRRIARLQAPLRDCACRVLSIRKLECISEECLVVSEPKQRNDSDNGDEPQKVQPQSPEHGCTFCGSSPLSLSFRC